MEPNLALTGEDLNNPGQPITVTPGAQQTATDFVSGSVSPFVQVESAEAQERDDLRQQLGEVPDGPSFEDTFQDQLKGLGTPDAMRDLRNVQQQLAGLNESFDLTNVGITEGSSIGQAQREVTQNERERAVRTASLAAKSQLLQGNIEQAQSIARDTVNFAFQDRQLELQTIRDQLDAVSGIVSSQEQQMIDQRKRELDAAEDALVDVKNNVSAAIVSGVASPEEVSVLTDPQIQDEDKMAIAQAIQARAAQEQLQLEQANIRSQISSRNADIELSRMRLQQQMASGGNPAGTLDKKPQTSAQLKAQGFADRLLESEQILSSIGDQFSGQFAFGGALPNQLQSSERQQFEQAKRNFINAVLRRESGAAIAESEFESAEKQYFPVRGDKEANLGQKAANRNTVINSIYRESNIPRPVMPGDIVESGGQKFEIAENGEDLIPIE